MRRRVMTRILLLLLLFATNAQAQYVNIPDANFRNFLQLNYPTCMSGGMLDTTCSAIVNETVLLCESNNIYDLGGIQYFDNLQELYCGHNNLSSLPSLPSHLGILNCNFNQLTWLPDLPLTLTSLECEYNQLLDFPPLPNGLIQLDCWINNISVLPTLPPTLEGLYCGGNNLTSIPSLPSSISNFGCDYNNLTSLPSFPSSLLYFSCSHNQITSLPALPSYMYHLQCDNNPISCLPPIQSIYEFFWDNTNIQCLPNYIAITNATPSIAGIPQCNTASGCPFVCNTPSSQTNHITFTNVTSSSATLNWTNGNGARRIVKIKPTNTFTAPANGNDYTANSVYSGSGEQVVYNGTGSSVTVTGLHSNTWYWFRVYEASCSSSNSLYYTSGAFHNPWKVFTQPSYNSNKPEEESDDGLSQSIQVYPNPTSGNITVEAAESAPIQRLTLYSSDGRIVKSIVNCPLSTVNLDLEGLSAGIYFLDCRTANGSERVKVVKY